MDALLLARIQFALTVGFHFLFPAMTLGTALIILISESIYLINGDETFRRITDFMARLLGAIFVVGAATGIVMEFSFGTNWSGYSRMVGDVFGPLLAAEGVIAFFLESVFIGVLLFGRGRVSKGVYWTSAFLVFLGGHLSAFWIVVANSWMQTPAGFMITPEGKLYLTSFTEAVFNASTLPRFLHTVLASWITCGVMGAGIAAYWLLTKRHLDTAKKLMKISMILFLVTPLLQLGTGHLHAKQVIDTQPSKAASLEGHFDSEKAGVPLYAAGWVDEENGKTYGIAIPGLLSFLNDWSFTSKMTGLNDIPPDERPPVNFVFQTYHIMVGIGMLLIGLGLVGGYPAGDGEALHGAVVFDDTAVPHPAAPHRPRDRVDERRAGQAALGGISRAEDRRRGVGRGAGGKHRLFADHVFAHIHASVYRLRIHHRPPRQDRTGQMIGRQRHE